MEALLSIVSSDVFKKWVLSPLAVVGFYQIIRGVAMVIEKDISEQDWIDGWVRKVYLAITVLGCLSLIVAL